MYKSYSIKDIFILKTDEIVKVKGWVQSRRDSKTGFSFINMKDGSCGQTLQIIAKNSLKNYFTEVIKLTKDCSLEVEGKIIPSQGSKQTIEIASTSIKIIGWIKKSENYPISSKKHSLEFLRNHLHLRSRTNVIGAISRIRHQLFHAIHDFFYKRNFFWLNTPILTSNDCEGGGQLFEVNNTNQKKKFFKDKTFLTVSGQFHLESYCMSMSKVYSFGPSFRAERSNTYRHLSEFWMLEAEIAFANLQDSIEIAKDLLHSSIQNIIKQCEKDLLILEFFSGTKLLENLKKFLLKKFVCIEYTEAINILERSNKKFEEKAKWGIDLQSEHERFLCEDYFSSPLIIKNYPKAIKPFYMKINDDSDTVAGADIIIPGIGEIVGGGQREERPEVLEHRMKEHSNMTNNLSWYQDLRDYGTVPHSGFGMGFERILSYVTGSKNIRDVSPFPRTPGKLLL